MKQKHVILFAAAIFAGSCSGGGAPTVPSAAPAAPAPAPSTPAHTYNVGPYVAQFTEFPLPAGQSEARDITVGPDGAVWFRISNGLDRIVSTGKITPFPAPPFVSALNDTIASFNNALWYGADSFTLAPEGEEFLVRQGTSGPPAMAGITPLDTSISHLTDGPDGRLWATMRAMTDEVDAFNKDGFLTLRVPFPIAPAVVTLQGITSGPDGNLYVTAEASPGKVFQLSTTGTILNTFLLAPGSDPMGIVTGPDGALWVADPGTNSITRLTTTGVSTPFPLPTANAGPFEITKGSDGALWFTEQTGNAIGRITTGGSITEYPVPTLNAGVFGITSCPQQCENAHGRLWFTEQNSNKVAKFEF